MNTHSFPDRPWSFSIPRGMFVTAALLAWCGLLFAGEIHDAAVNGDLEKVKALIKNDPSLVSSKDECGRTPLHRAALLGHKDLIEWLLANKADANATDNYGRTALKLATMGGYKDVVDLLRQHGGKETATPPEPTTPPPAKTNAAPAATTKPASTTDTATPPAAKSPGSNSVKAPPQSSPDPSRSTNNYGRMPLRPAKHKDTSELLR